MTFRCMRMAYTLVRCYPITLAYLEAWSRRAFRSPRIALAMSYRNRGSNLSALFGLYFSCSVQSDCVVNILSSRPRGGEPAGACEHAARATARRLLRAVFACEGNECAPTPS